MIVVLLLVIRAHAHGPLDGAVVDDVAADGAREQTRRRTKDVEMAASTQTGGPSRSTATLRVHRTRPTATTNRPTVPRTPAILRTALMDR